MLGVLAPSFDTVDLTATAPDIWIPLGIDPKSDSQAGYFFSAARLRTGVSVDQANGRLTVLAESFKQQFPNALRSTVTFGVQPLRGLIVRDVRRSLLVLYAAVATVLFIACVNIGNLMLVRVTGRQAEMAMRTALGASRGRIIRQLLTEGVVLSMAGGMGGLILGAMVLPRASALVAGQLPRMSAELAPHVDWRVLLVIALTCAAATVLLGVIPALHAGRAVEAVSLNDRRSGTSARRALHVRKYLVIAEVALAVILLVGAVLLLRTFASLRNVNPGFDATHLLSLRTSLSEPGLTTNARVAGIVEEGIDHMRRQPGVTTAAASLCCLPLENQGFLPFIVPGRPLDGPFHAVGTWWAVSPEFFDALRIPLVRGRPFTRDDRLDTAGVVIINQTLARRFFSDSDPIGQLLLLGKDYLPGTVMPRRIVGIAGDVRDAAISREASSTTYVPMTQLDDAQIGLVVKAAPVVWVARTVGEPAAPRTGARARAGDWNRPSRSRASGPWTRSSRRPRLGRT